MANNLLLLSAENIRSRIHTIRGMQVMLDSDLAEMYNVETKVLNQAVKRNSERFPQEFMFQLTQN
ncbi:MAG: ORF6N domain-containing protein, partial [Candidatus Nanoarchaeia archaeon]